MSYADLAELKRHLQLGASSADDTDLQRNLDTASRQIDQLCSRTFDVAGDTPTARWFTPYYDRRSGRWRVPVDDVQDTTGLTVDSWNDTDEGWTTAVAGPFAYYPINASSKGMPFTELVLAESVSLPSPDWRGWTSDDSKDYLQITALWGWTAVPEPVVTACLLQAARLFKRRDALFGITSAPGGADSVRLQDRMDADAVAALRGYIKYWAAR